MLEVAGAVVLVAADHVTGLLGRRGCTAVLALALVADVCVHGVAPRATLAATTLVALVGRLLGVGPGRRAGRGEPAPPADAGAPRVPADPERREAAEGGAP